MDYNFYILEQTRSNILNAIKDYSMEELNKIPEGFNNNLIWNFGHVIVTQQLLCYGLSGLPMHLADELVSKYRKGSKPIDFVDEAEFEFLKEKAFQLIEQTKKDHAAGIFKAYKSYTTSFNVTINSVEEGITFNNVHEGLHFGSILALRKLI